MKYINELSQKFKNVNSVDIGQYLFLSLASCLLLTWNFFYPSLILSISVPILIIAANKIIEIPKIKPGYLILIISLIVMVIIKNGTNLLYPKFKDYQLYLIALTTIATGLLFFRFNEKKIKVQIATVSILYFIIGTVVIKISPEPKIDVYEFLTKSSKIILNGETPYFNKNAIADKNYYEKNNMSELYNLYMKEAVSEGYLPYSPILILTATTGYVFGDVRYAGVLSLTIIIILCGYLFDHVQKWVKPIIFYFIFSSIFFIEQAWTDHTVLLIFIIFLILLKKRRVYLASFVLGILLLSKLYMLVILPFCFIGLFYEDRSKINLKLIALFMFGLILPFLVIAPLGVEGLWHYIRYDMWFFNDIEYPFSNSIANYLKRSLGVNLYSLNTLGLFLFLFYYLVKKIDKNVFSSIWFFSYAFLVYFLFNKTLFYNYVWIAISFVLVTTPLHDKKNCLSFNDLFYISSRVFALIFMPPILSDISRYGIVFSELQMGKLPYLEFVYEYPFMSLLQIIIPGFVTIILGSKSLWLFRFFFMLTVLIADIYLYFKLKKDHPNRVGFYIVMSFLLFPFYFDRLDLVMMWFIFLSIYLTEQKKYVSSMIATLAGGWYKIVPFITSLYIYKSTNFKKSYIYGFVFSNLFLITVLSFLFKSETLSFLTYHHDRPFQIESLVASAYVFFCAVFHVDYEVITSFGSKNIIFPFSDLFLVITKCLVLVTALWLFFTYMKERINFRRFLYLLILSSVTLSSVFSTQYLIWIMVALVFSDMYEFYGLFEKFVMFVVFVISSIVFINYFEFIEGNIFYICALFLRNLMLIYLMVFSLVKGVPDFPSFKIISTTAKKRDGF